MTSKIPRCCHPDDRKDLALSLAKSQRGMLRFAQHDTKYLSKHLYFLLILIQKGAVQNIFPVFICLCPPKVVNNQIGKRLMAGTVYDYPLRLLSVQVQSFEFPFGWPLPTLPVSCLHPYPYIKLTLKQHHRNLEKDKEIRTFALAELFAVGEAQRCSSRRAALSFAKDNVALRER